ncbi:MAG: hypothetical protein K2H22_05905 [Muribaculaceae bacterium]|nr:hypothetical protein [Muribaculaceae bacterium]
MKKKVLYGVALALISSVSMGTLQSCKDDVSDLEQRITYDQAGLKQKIEALQNALEECQKNCKESLADHENRITKNSTDIANLQAQLATINGLIGNLVTTEELQKQIKLLSDRIAALENAGTTTPGSGLTEDQVKQLIAESISGINQTLIDLGDKIEGVDKIVKGLKEELEKYDLTQIEKNKAEIAGLKTRMETQEEAVRVMTIKMAELEATVEGHTEEIERVKAAIEEMKGQIDQVAQDINQVNQEINELWVQLNQTNENIGQIYAALNDKIAVVETNLLALTGRLDNLITNILVQATDSPVFGNFSLPLGVQSNLLFNWFGYNDKRQFEFPSANSMDNYYDAQPALTEEDLDNLNPVTFTIPRGPLGDVNLGKLFLTVNPAGHYFNSEGFSLETTKENKYPATLNVKKSDEELYFGYSRSFDKVEGNGFYEADVIVKKEQLGAAKIEIEDGLKAAAKDALKDPSRRTAVGLLKAVYSQLNGMLPQYGVRYDWSVNGQPYSVLSNYNLAAATAKPLSYSFLYGQGTSKRIRTFGHIDNLILKLKEEGKLHFKFDPISFKDINIELPPIDIKPEKVDPTTNMVTITIDPIHVTGEGVDAWTETKTVDVHLESVVNDLSKEINDAISSITSQIQGWSADANKNLSAQVQDALNPVADQINKMMDSINGQIDDMLGDLGNQFQPYFDRLNKLVDLYNKVANKINDVLADPNHYLQVAMFYNSGNGNVGILSNSFKSPTIFKNGNGYVALYASSYSGEIVAPAFKKYVAVTNIYNEKKEKVTTPAALAAINSNGKFLNEVMNGETIRFGVATSDLKKDYIYEIVYQGVDYSGRTSTQKFYIQVK